MEKYMVCNCHTEIQVAVSDFTETYTVIDMATYFICFNGMAGIGIVLAMPGAYDGPVYV